MKSVPRHWVLSALLAACSTPWAAPSAPADPLQPIERYRVSTIVKLSHCQYSHLLALRNERTGQAQTEDSDFMACSAALKASAPGALKQVLKVGARKPLRLAIQSYHATFLKGIDGLPRLPDEADEAYQARQLDLANEINTAWEAVENNR